MELQDNTDIYIPQRSAVIMDDFDLLKDKTVTYNSILIEGQWIFEPLMDYKIICNTI
jgi:hypothetical protein